MANHVKNIPPPRPLPALVPTYTVHRTGEYGAQTNKTTGEVKIQPVKMNSVISQRLENTKSTDTRQRGPTNQNGQRQWKMR